MAPPTSVGRPFAAAFEPIVKQPVVIETKAGAAGAVGAQVAANAKPDGYTLLVHITSISGFAEVDKLFGRKPKFTRADFIPIARFVADPCVLLVNDQQPYKTLAELTADAKKRPDEIIFSSSGLYGALHIPTALYMKAAGGSNCATCRPMAADPRSPPFSATTRTCWFRRSRLRYRRSRPARREPLAMFGATRSKALPDVPTMKELGYDIEYYLWVGLFAPKGTPADVVSYLRTNAGKAAHSDLFKTAITNLGQELGYQDQPEFAKFWDADAARIEGAVKEIGRVQG